MARFRENSRGWRVGTEVLLLALMLPSADVTDPDGQSLIRLGRHLSGLGSHLSGFDRWYVVS
jgi:hypothetical protein